MAKLYRSNKYVKKYILSWGSEKYIEKNEDVQMSFGVKDILLPRVIMALSNRPTEDEWQMMQKNLGARKMIWDLDGRFGGTFSRFIGSMPIGF